MNTKVTTFLRKWLSLTVCLGIVVAAHPTSAAMFKRIGALALEPNEDTVSIHVVSNVAYCLMENSGIVAVDVSNPSAPTRLNFIAHQGSFEDIFVTNGIAYVTGGTFFNQPNPNPVFTAIDLQSSSVIAETYGPNLVWDIEFRGNTAYLIDPFNFVTVLDLATPAAPQQLAKFQPHPSYIINDLALTSNLVYVADSHGLSVYNMTNPVAPSLAGGFATAFYGFEMEFDGLKGFLATYDYPNQTGRVHILSFSNNIATPTELGRIEISDFTHNLGVMSNYVIFNLRSPTVGLVAYNVTNAASSFRAAQYSPASSRNKFGDLISNFEVLNGYIYIVGEFGLQILEIDPNESDSDFDGMSDDWETDNNLNPDYAADANSDDDNDGATAYQEYIAGTNPEQAQSVFRAAVSMTGNLLTLSWPSVAGRDYAIYRSSTLNWGPSAFPEVLQVVAATPPTNTFTTPIIGTGGPSYYFLDVQLVAE